MLSELLHSATAGETRIARSDQPDMHQPAAVNKQLTQTVHAEAAITNEHTAAEQAEQTIDATRRTDKFDNLLHVHLPADNFAWVPDTAWPALGLVLVLPILTALEQQSAQGVSDACNKRKWSGCTA